MAEGKAGDSAALKARRNVSIETNPDQNEQVASEDKSKGSKKIDKKLDKQRKAALDLLQKGSEINKDIGVALK